DLHLVQRTLCLFPRAGKGCWWYRIRAEVHSHVVRAETGLDVAAFFIDLVTHIDWCSPFSAFAKSNEKSLLIATAGVVRRINDKAFVRSNSWVDILGSLVSNTDGDSRCVGAIPILGAIQRKAAI